MLVEDYFFFVLYRREERNILGNKFMVGIVEVLLFRCWLVFFFVKKIEFLVVEVFVFFFKKLYSLFFENKGNNK